MLTQGKLSPPRNFIYGIFAADERAGAPSKTGYSCGRSTKTDDCRKCREMSDGRTLQPPPQENEGSTVRKEQEESTTANGESNTTLGKDSSEKKNSPHIEVKVSRVRPPDKGSFLAGGSSTFSPGNKPVCRHRRGDHARPP